MAVDWSRKGVLLVSVMVAFSWTGKSVFTPAFDSEPYLESRFSFSLSPASNRSRPGEYAVSIERSRIVSSLFHAVPNTRSVIAIELLQRRLLADPTSAELMSDLAAAHLVRADGDAESAFSGLVLAHRATSLCPTCAGSRFNLALALEKIGVSGIAAGHWKGYLSLDGQSRWADHAVSSLRASDSSRGSLGRRDVSRPLELELLPALATRRLDDGGSDVPRRVAEARLGAPAVDRLLLDALDAFPPDRRETWAGLVALRRGFTALDALAGSRSAEQRAMFLDRARRHLLAASEWVPKSDPMSLWVRYYLAKLAFVDRRDEQAFSTATGVLAEIEGHHYPKLAGRLHLMRGFVLQHEADFSKTAFELAAAGSLFHRAGESTLAAQAWSAGAWVLAEAGDYAGAWERLCRALRELPPTAEADTRRRLVLGDAADIVGLRGEWPLALLFETAALELLDPGEHPRSYARAEVELAQTALRAEDFATAERKLAAVAARIEELGGRCANRDLYGSYGLVQGELLAGSDALASLDLLERAKRALEAGDSGDGSGRGRFDFRLPAVERVRALALRTLGRLGEATAAAESAVAGLERIRRSLDSERDRVTYLDRQRAVYDLAVSLNLDRGRHHRALAWAEMGRSRVLAERLKVAGDERGDSPGTRSVDDAWIAGVPDRLADSAVLVFSQLPGRLVVWVIEPGRPLAAPSVVASDRVTSAALISKVESGLAVVDRAARSSTALDAVSALLSGVLQRVSQYGKLVVVPDGDWQRIPFAALKDTEGRYLVEQATVVMAPSLRLAAGGLSPAHGAGRWHAIAIAVDGSASNQLQRLAHVADEARDVVARHGGQLLVGQMATPERVLRQLATVDLAHFAVHAEAGVRRRESRLWLSPGDSDDGSLTASRIAASQLSDLRLVVLLACGTARGPLSSSEGAASIAHAFLAAGVPTVIATNWAIDDRVSHRMAGLLHNNLAAGHPPATALRLAQQDLLSSGDPALSGPHGWAAFATYRAGGL